MTKTWAVISSIAAAFFVVVAIIAMSYIGANNYGASVESSLKASRENNMNILTQYQQKIMEAAQVPDMYKSDFKEVLQASMEGRYGPNGSQATFQWLKEHNINFDASIYKKIQDMIEGGRKDFELGQTKMIDIRRGYDAQLGFFWRGMWLRIAGFPKLNLEIYKPVVTDAVEKVFETNKEVSPLKLR